MVDGLVFVIVIVVIIVFVFVIVVVIVIIIVVVVVSSWQPNQPGAGGGEVLAKARSKL